ncbi:50S ribosomal protein L23 [Buchnera aphidicola]|uniref:50S ribosomal protein L23 n=1 Tax=Buchnera aphidicola TaxID=9 RepID=UPI0030EF7212
MKSYNRLLNIIKSLHISEKTTQIKENSNIIVLKVLKSATKREIKIALKKFLFLHSEKINIVQMKGKKKSYGNKIFFKQDWKKAYIKLKKDQNLDFLNNHSG